jgi:hypothetical protein
MTKGDDKPDEVFNPYGNFLRSPIPDNDDATDAQTQLEEELKLADSEEDEKKSWSSSL